MDTLEKIIYENYRLAFSKGEFPDNLPVTTAKVAQKIREAGFHRHDAPMKPMPEHPEYPTVKVKEYCSCDSTREDLRNGYHPYHCVYCRLPFHPTPKRKRIEPIDLSEVVVKQGLDGLGIVVRIIQDKINELCERANEEA